MLLLCALATLGGCNRTASPGAERAPPLASPPVAAEASFAGSDACAGCHADEAAAWRGSQHARAMQHATEATVLGDFDDARLRYAGVESRFFRRDGWFFVRTDGADGRLADFEIRYAFGVEPLQQYLVEFSDGRLQALSIAWDARPKERGGQRWFHLYPKERVDHRDELHWTRRSQNWNFMCADCHSTNVRKNYDAATNTFRTAYSEISVACEACHGPGSAHVELARTRPAGSARALTVQLDERRGIAWTMNPASGNAVRSAPRASERELQVCAQCHSRRSQTAEGYRAGAPFLDHYRPALLGDGSFHADGQQRDEVYTWASFLQSRMHHAGVTCSDCHDPHSGKLRAEGNAVCAQCHSPQKYDTRGHHHHDDAAPRGRNANDASGRSDSGGNGNGDSGGGDSGSASGSGSRGSSGGSGDGSNGGSNNRVSDGTSCVDCHMPATTYMEIDPRRDHSLRVPRPDLSVALGTPNACSKCHTSRDAQWAADALITWNGRQPGGFQHWAGAFAAHEGRRAEAASALAAVAADASSPAIARASALEALAAYPVLGSVEAARSALGDPSPLVRRSAVATLAMLPPPQRLEWLSPLLQDPLRIVRIEAAERLADALHTASPEQRAAFEHAAAEYEAMQRYNADRPEARTALGDFRMRQGRLVEARADLESALQLDPGFIPAYVNLADLHRALGREDEAERVLRDGLRLAGDDAMLRHALGLTLARRQQLPAALRELAAATRLAPEDARFAYVYAAGLESAGQHAAALRELDRALGRHPDDRDLLIAAASYGGAHAGARHAQRLAERHRDDPAVTQFLLEWSRQRSPVR